MGKYKKIFSASLSTGLIGLIRLYQFFLSPWLGGQCRFFPSCSVYAIEAIQEHGVVYGTYWMLHRLLRCHPGCQSAYDPVKPKKSHTSLH